MADFLLEPSGGWSLFLRAGFVLGCLMLVSSCLQPQNVEMEEESPRLPPEIDAKSISPDTRVVCVDGSTSTAFRLTVRSPDGRPLKARWFVDYPLNVDVSGSTAIRSEESLDPTGEEEIPTFKVELDQADLGLIPKTDNPHTVEVVIATAFSEDKKAFPRNRALATGGYSASFKWVVESQENCAQ
jgi:hypothetical protein